jgi:thiol-disulfide isomerase/thioredoxin
MGNSYTPHVEAGTRVTQGSARPGRRRQRGYLVAALLLIAVAVIGVLVGTRTDPTKVTGTVDTSNLKVLGTAPALDAEGWINSPPLSTGALRGKVTLYDFWTYSCVNCQRTFPYLRSWFDRYRADGLVVIGVHSPEFDFEKVHANVEDAVKRDHVTWPVALDDNMKIWNKFKNQYWPADYVADRNGKIRYKHFGEGDYTNTENVIRSLLGVKSTEPRATRVTGAQTSSSETTNPETYLGLQYQNPAQPLIDVEPGSHDYPAPSPASIAAPHLGPNGEILLARNVREAALVGRWTAADESVTADAAAASIRIAVHAKEVNLVMASKSGRPVDAFIQLDGQPVPVSARGSSVHLDQDGRTVVTVDASDMYRLLLTPTVGDHVLSISATAPGLTAYSFTFG